MSDGQLRQARRSRARSRSRPAEAAAYGPVGRRAVAGRRLALPPALADRGRRGGQHDRARPRSADGGQPLVFVHGLSGCWANFLEQLPAMAREHRVVTLDLPGFGYSPMPSEEDHDLRLRAAAGRAAGTARDRRRRRRRQLDGRVHRGGAGDRLPAAGRAAGAGVVGRHLHARRRWRGSAPPGHQEPDPGAHAQRAGPGRHGGVAGVQVGHRRAAASGCASSRSRRSCATRDRLPAPLAAEQLRGAGKPGFLQAFEAIIDYDVEERLKEIACPTLIVWGDRGPPRQRRATRTCSPP